MNNNKDNNDQDNDKNNRKGINKQLQKNEKKNTRLIFENVTATTLNQPRFKNLARSMNAVPFLLTSLYIIIIITYFILSIY